MQSRFFIFVFLILLLIPSIFSQQNSQEVQQEESEDYYQKWLNEDVLFIISDEEKTIFEKTHVRILFC